MQKISPFLWLSGNGEEAVEFYTSVFKNAEVKNVNRMGGKLFSATIVLEGQEFMILNWENEFTFNEKLSFFINCKDQAEVDELWDKLLAGGGEESRCGWLKDKFGLFWQVIPEALGRLMGDPDPVKSQRVMQAMMKMVKIDVAALETAYNNE